MQRLVDAGDAPDEPGEECGAPRRTTWQPPVAVDVARTLALLSRGRRDPTYAVDAGGGIWRTTVTPQGPATLHLRTRPAGEVDASAWGPGADWVLAGVPELLGAGHRCEGFAPPHRLVRELHRRHPGVRLPRTRSVFEALVPAVLEQKVVGMEARRSWRELVLRFGSRAPGPAPPGLRVMPEPRTWSLVPSWEWHRAGVDAKRSRTIMAAARMASRLEEAVTMSPAGANQRLRAVPGVGPWTAAEIALRALGDCDAVSIGDYHLPSFVGRLLAGRPVDDDGMLELLAAYRPHRARAVRLLELSGFRTPRFGPRYAAQDLRGC